MRKLLIYITFCGLLSYFHICFSYRVVKNEEAWRFASLNESTGRYLRDASTLSTPTKPDEHRVNNLPGLSHSDSSSFVQYAGHLLADPVTNGFHFYWLFESAKEANSKPLIIWLNGGPGCSSMDGLFLELGPLRLSNDGKSIRINSYSWLDAGNLLFIDQPVGTGLSFTKGKDGYAKNDDMINSHFYTFLTNFLNLHSRYVSKTDSTRVTRKIFFTGESHAGHYISTMVAYILDKNNNLPSDGIKIQVEGIALGNPWLDPKNQYNPAEFAHGLGMLTGGQVNKIHEQEMSCRAQLSKGILSTKICLDLLDAVVDSTSTSGAQKVLMYDVRKFVHSTKSFPPGHNVVESYLNNIEVKRAIHAAGNTGRYVECSDPPYFALLHQDGKDVVPELVKILDAGLRVLVYAGQYDLICNHRNLEKVLDSIPWKESSGWQLAQPSVWVREKKPVGFWRSHKNLNSLLILDAGHMVPMDLPEISLQMIKTFVQNTPFAGGTSKIGVSSVSSADCASAAPVVADAAANARALTSADMSTSPAMNSSTVSTKVSKVGHHGAAKELKAKNAVTFYPVIAHATLHDRAVYLRMRTQHLANTASNHHHHHQQSHLSFQAWEAVLESEFFLLVNPGGKSFPFQREWFNASQHHHHIDVVVDGLAAGEPYSFSVGHNHDIHLPASAQKILTLKPGCFHSTFVQCCGHGDCVKQEGSAGAALAATAAGSRGAAATVCRCDLGYAGEHCSHYKAAAVGDMAMNVSSEELSCPLRIDPPPGIARVNYQKPSTSASQQRAPESSAAPAPGCDDSHCCSYFALNINMMDSHMKSLASSASILEHVLHGKVMHLLNSIKGAQLQMQPLQPKADPSISRSGAASNVALTVRATNEGKAEMSLCGLPAVVNSTLAHILMAISPSASAAMDLAHGHTRASVGAMLYGPVEYLDSSLSPNSPVTSNSTSTLQFDALSDKSLLPLTVVASSFPTFSPTKSIFAASSSEDDESQQRTSTSAIVMSISLVIVFVVAFVSILPRILSFRRHFRLSK